MDAFDGSSYFVADIMMGENCLVLFRDIVALEFCGICSASPLAVFEAAFDPTAQANIGRRETGINRLVPVF